MDQLLDAKLDALHQLSQKKLFDIFDHITGKKDLIIDLKLMKQLECIVGVSALR